MQHDPDRPTVTRPQIPRWVKGFVVAGVLVLALGGVMMATGHGPGRHFGAHTAATP
jgi:hypothetical protein